MSTIYDMEDRQKYPHLCKFCVPESSKKLRKQKENKHNIWIFTSSNPLLNDICLQQEQFIKLSIVSDSWLHHA